MKDKDYEKWADTKIDKAKTPTKKVKRLYD